MRDRHYHARAWDWYSYRSRGEYAPQVARWLDAYGPDRVLVMRSEDMYANPSATVARVQDFVGLERCEPRSTRRNAAPGSGIDADSAADLRRHFGQHNKELARLLGTPVWWD